ncbi:hypothetical protein ACFQ3S_03480 [Mucilaginibacter terrae]|uniref:hypothetical protein n=1 Tax=Mucilaginibacter terrae TaxID=1955052 RepID=UPI003641F38E
MADFQSHINQAKKNLIFLSEVNQKISNSWDWQVTTAYYVAVHLVNSHIAKTANMHFSSHERVKNALYDPKSFAKIDDSVYLAYVKLENLSRRARYLCNDNGDKTELDMTFVTHDVHLKKALSKLDVLIDFITKTHGQSFNIIPINCIEIKKSNLLYFKYRG